MTFKKEAAENSKESQEENKLLLKKVEDKLENMDKKNDKLKIQIEEIKEDMKENKKKNDEIFQRIDKRMIDIEEAMRKSNILRTKEKGLRKSLLDKANKWKTVVNWTNEKLNNDGGEVTIEDEEESEPASQTEESAPSSQMEVGKPFTSSWAKDVADQLKQAADNIVVGKRIDTDRMD